MGGRGSVSQNAGGDMSVGMLVKLACNSGAVHKYDVTGHSGWCFCTAGVDTFLVSAATSDGFGLDNDLELPDGMAARVWVMGC